MTDRGTPWEGRAKVSEGAAGFHADLSDLPPTCDDVRIAGDLAVCLRTLTGHDAGRGIPIEFRDREGWGMDAELKMKSSRSWCDADDCARQAAEA